MDLETRFVDGIVPLACIMIDDSNQIIQFQNTLPQSSLTAIGIEDMTNMILEINK